MPDRKFDIDNHSNHAAEPAVFTRTQPGGEAKEFPADALASERLSVNEALNTAECPPRSPLAPPLVTRQRLRA